MRTIVLLSFLWLAAAIAHAGGFEVSNHSARAMGLGGAFVAAPNDASSLYANPSAISFLRGTHLSIGAMIMVPESKFALATDPGNTWKTQSQVLFPPNISLTQTFADGFAFGVCASVPFYVKNVWPGNWPASQVTTHSEIRGVFVSPTISAKLFPSLSLGASLNIVIARMLTSRSIGFADLGQPDGTQSMDGSGKTMLGYGVGFLFHPDEVWSLGAAYRSRMSIPVEHGTVTFTDIPAGQTGNFPNSTFSTDMTLPDHVTAGIGCHPFKGLYLSGEVEYMYWSALSSMALTFSDAALQTNPRLETEIPFQWKNSLTARSGVEITIGDVNLRAGFAYEQSPVPDGYMRPSVPDAKRKVYSGGVGYAVSEDLHVDFACSFARFEERTVNSSLVEYSPGAYLNGTYASSLTMIGINMSYSWNN
jgi:long-chain fatty acid transport protein